jgi:hypothetical protein
MKCNIGVTDRIVRILIGLIIGLLGLYFNSWWGLLGIIPLATAFVRFCPLYKLLGTGTCGEQTQKVSSQ